MRQRAVLIGLMSLALMFAVAEQARANTTFEFSFESQAISFLGHGTLVGNAIENGIYSITDGTALIDEQSFTLVSTQSQITLNHPYELSPLGAFWYDDILFFPVSSGQPQLTGYGLLFTSTDQTNPLEVNIWGNGPNIHYTAYTGLGPYNFPKTSEYNVIFSARPVPEPSTMLLLGSALLGLAAFRKRR